MYKWKKINNKYAFFLFFVLFLSGYAHEIRCLFEVVSISYCIWEGHENQKHWFQFESYHEGNCWQKTGFFFQFEQTPTWIHIWQCKLQRKQFTVIKCNCPSLFRVVWYTHFWLTDAYFREIREIYVLNKNLPHF